jgi:hypothetical protein
MRMWKAGLVAAVMAGVAGFGCGGVEPADADSSGATERYLRSLEDDDNGNQCGEPVCRTITREKNITHVFFDFGDCVLEEGDFTVTVDGVDFTDRLKSRGGPCRELDADFRIELPGPARTATVCVTFTGRIAEDVRIGSKAGSACRYEADSLRAQKKDDDGHGNQCKPCEQED